MRNDCDCEKGRKRVRVLDAHPADPAPVVEPRADPAREGQHSLACINCLDMHLAYALELSYEPNAEQPYSEERFLLIGTLRAAQDHAAALGLAPLAARIRATRLALDDRAPSECVPPFVRAYIAERASENLRKADI